MRLVGTTNLWNTDMWVHIWRPSNWFSWHVDQLPHRTLHTITLAGFVFWMEVAA